MTIHKSKGLEFPVLFLYGAAAGSGAQREKVFFSENYGMGFSFMYGGETEDNAAGGFLLRSIGESPALRVLKNESRKEELCEEQRLLYVAMTRAREKLFVTAEVSADKLEDQMSVMCGGALTPVCGDLSVKSVKSYLDMIYLAVFGKDAEESWRVRRIQGVSGRLGEENGIRRVREIKAVLSGETVLDMSDGNTCRTEKAVNTENVDNVTANSFVNIQATESPEKRQTERFLKVIEEADDGRLPQSYLCPL